MVAMPQLLAAKLRSLRLHYGFTQVEVAHRLGLRAHARIGQLEGVEAAGRAAPSLTLLVRLALIFRVPTDYLLRDTIPVEPLPGVSMPCEPVMPIQPHLGTTLRQLRMTSQLSQSMVATQLSLAQRGYVGHLETGRKTPSPELLVRLADLFNVSTDALLCKDEG